jgi:hypothetical protein
MSGLHGPIRNARAMVLHTDCMLPWVVWTMSADAVLLSETMGPDVSVLEGNAPAHVSILDNQFFKLYDVKKLLGPANSPDAKAIEHAWPWLRRSITQDFPPSLTIEECERQ